MYNWMFLKRVILLDIGKSRVSMYTSYVTLRNGVSSEARAEKTSDIRSRKKGYS